MSVDEGIGSSKTSGDGVGVGGGIGVDDDASTGLGVVVGSCKRRPPDPESWTFSLTVVTLAFGCPALQTRFPPVRMR